MKPRLRGILKILIIFVSVIAAALGGIAWWWSRPVPISYPDHWLDLSLEGEGPFRAGASRVSITPTIDPEGDPIWLAGYQTMRAATGVHDDLWARALVVQAGEVKIAMVAVDVIGIFEHEVITIREALDPDLEVDGIDWEEEYVPEDPKDTAHMIAEAAVEVLRQAKPLRNHLIRFEKQARDFLSKVGHKPLFDKDLEDKRDIIRQRLSDVGHIKNLKRDWIEPLTKQKSSIDRKALEEIGKKFSVSRERIRQIQMKALTKLRRNKEDLQPFFD